MTRPWAKPTVAYQLVHTTLRPKSDRHVAHEMSSRASHLALCIQCHHLAPRCIDHAAHPNRKKQRKGAEPPCASSPAVLVASTPAKHEPSSTATGSNNRKPANPDLMRVFAAMRQAWPAEDGTARKQGFSVRLRNKVLAHTGTYGTPNHIQGYREIRGGHMSERGSIHTLQLSCHDDL